MAEKIKAEDEPSIEEILDSIRQIISEDDKEEASADEEPELEESVDDIFAEEDEPEPEPQPEPEIFESIEEDDVFELTERVMPEIVIPPPIEVPVAKIEEEPFVVDLIDETIKNEPEPVVEKPVKPQPAEPKLPVQDTSSADSILTESAETAAFSAIAELARRTAVEHSSGITLEDIVRAELKPLLRSWLDKNLPIVIERLVREELERVSKRVLED